MADINTVKELIRLTRVARVSLFLWGTHGIGKSSIVKEVAQEMGIGFVDFRCAQIEACDLRGLPDKVDGRTVFCPSAELPSAGRGILFLDELNRATADVLSAAFQLVLDRRVGEYCLPEGWSIVSAGNLENGDYHVAELDPAFRDRFCHAVLSAGVSTFDEWTDWISERYPEMAFEVVNFCSGNLKHLEVVENESLGFQVLPSRRSWEMAIRCLSVARREGFSERCRVEVLAGLIGRELAVAFQKHRSPVSPHDLLSSGVAELAEQITRLNRNQKMALMWGLFSHVRDQLHDRDRAKVALDFAELLIEQEKDLAIGFCVSLLSGACQADEQLTNAQYVALLTNTRLTAAMARVNSEEGKTDSLVNYLAERPKLSRAVAQAMSQEADTNVEEVCL